MVALLFLLACNLMNGPATNPNPLGSSAAETSATRPTRTTTVDSRPPQRSDMFRVPRRRFANWWARPIGSSISPPLIERNRATGCSATTSAIRSNRTESCSFSLAAYPTTTFKGKPNLGNGPPGIPDDNDAIAFTTDTSLNPCIKLNFITN